MRGRPMMAAALVPALLAVGCGDDAEDGQDAADSPPASESEAGGGDEDVDEEPAEEPAPEPEDERYEVQSGDTLSRIANEHDVTIEALVEANELEDPDVLLEGQELVIPASTTDADDPEGQDAEGAEEAGGAEPDEQGEGAEEQEDEG